MKTPDDEQPPLAPLLDFVAARARRRLSRVASGCIVVETPPARQDPEPGQEENPPSRAERIAQKRRRLAERTARRRAAAARHRIQLRVADRLAKIEAELQAELARLRLAYTGRRLAGRERWIWPTAVLSMLLLVAGLAFFAGTQQHRIPPDSPPPAAVAKRHVKAKGAARRAPMKRAHGVKSSSCSGSGPGCGGTPYRSMSPASGSTGGTP